MSVFITCNIKKRIYRSYLCVCFAAISYQPSGVITRVTFMPHSLQSKLCF